MKRTLITFGVAAMLAACAGTVTPDVVYTDGAIALNVALQSGKLTGEQAKLACVADIANFGLLLANTAPGTDHSAAIITHSAVQDTCAPFK